MVSPEKLEFLRDKLNILDVAAVLPFYVPLFISWLEQSVITQVKESEPETEIMASWTIEAGSETMMEDMR